MPSICQGFVRTNCHESARSQSDDRGRTASARPAARRRRRSARGCRRPRRPWCCAAGPAPARHAGCRARARPRDLGYRPDRTASLLARAAPTCSASCSTSRAPSTPSSCGRSTRASADRGLDLVLGTTTPRTRRAPRRRDAARLPLRGARAPRPADVRPRPRRPRRGVPHGRRRAGRHVRRVAGVRAADDQGLEVAVDHLASLGHRRIAFVDGPRGSIARARRQGYRDAMARHGVGAQADVVRGGRTEADGAAAAQRLLSRALTDRPTAVVCFNDRVAIGLRDALVRAGHPGARGRLGRRLRRQPSRAARHGRPHLGEPGAAGARGRHGGGARGAARRCRTAGEGPDAARPRARRRAGVREAGGDSGDRAGTS